MKRIGFFLMFTVLVCTATSQQIGLQSYNQLVSNTANWVEVSNLVTNLPQSGQLGSISLKIDFYPPVDAISGGFPQLVQTLTPARYSLAWISYGFPYVFQNNANLVPLYVKVHQTTMVCFTVAKFTNTLNQQIPVSTIAGYIYVHESAAQLQTSNTRNSN